MNEGTPSIQKLLYEAGNLHAVLDSCKDSMSILNKCEDIHVRIHKKEVVKSDELASIIGDGLRFLVDLSNQMENFFNITNLPEKLRRKSGKPKDNT